ncbi:MAG: beta-ketoacyl-[acyl-carrier-protein] synthase family protein [Puniceicoccales bacterium]|jgi:3-oxoacyl-[acyl-carrier-protein] synthase-1|nr:beta-ketoacyl-[acyl-carrier-protein] synthase family protein [Puniceicoccales bacterium]
MRNAVITGLGFITSIGNDKSTVAASLRKLQHGLAPYAPFCANPCIPVKLTGAIRDFDTLSPDAEDWIFPSRYTIRREHLRCLAPHGLYACCALEQALADAALSPGQVSHPSTGMFTASAGSASMMHHNLTRMHASGVMRCTPMGVINSVAGTLNFNLVAIHKILGATCGFSSACASSAHALGYALEEIRHARQDRMIVVGGEDGNLEAILPFAGMRALSTTDDPALASCPFDKARSGFVGTGGATAMILEEETLARARQAHIYARFTGWGQASDGHNPAISHPDGIGLATSMKRCLADAAQTPATVDYINAHATSTPIGDRSELIAINTVFTGEKKPSVSSTKGLTGHALSMASILEAAICCIALDEQFIPGNAHLRNPDPAAAPLPLPRTTQESHLRTALTNSSGFGGANVSLLFERAP